MVNIRLRLYRVLPSLKAILKLPADRLLLQQLEQVIRKCISQERDVDASQAIRDAVSQLDKIEVAMETVSAKLIPSLYPSLLLLLPLSHITAISENIS